MSENPIAQAMAEFNERVAKPWAAAINERMAAFGQEFTRLRAETRAKPCPCGCGHTIGEVVGDGIVNPHMLFRR
jgi:hypothetical protein